MRENMESDVQLRDVIEDDLPIFYVQQLDPEANQMAAFPARDEPSFMAHWAKVLADETVVKQTIVCDGQVAGNLVCFGEDGEREVGYWLGRDFWGMGVATQALSQFLDLVQMRPLFAYVARQNLPSQRVLAKCGFARVGVSSFLAEDSQVLGTQYVIYRRQA
jgi:RimJ/RimL family protein N-acetyltransferase